MGCWYSTCFMSNLPIMPGDDIAIFILAPNYPYERTGMTCHPTDKYVPLGFPIFAEYDDDVRVRNVREINEYMSRYLHEFVPAYVKTGSVLVHDVDGDVEVPSFEKYEWDDIEDFVRNVANQELYVNDRNGKKEKLEHVMVHTDLYNALIKNMAHRIPYDCTETYEDLVHTKVVKTIEWLKEDDDLRAFAREKYGIDNPIIFRRFSDRVHVETFNRWHSLDKLVNYYLETEDGCIIDDVVRYIMWAQVMDLSRRGYHCLTGAGSQSQEMMVQRVIAEYIIVKCVEREAEAEADGYDEQEDGSVLEETLYWWND